MKKLRDAVLRALSGRPPVAHVVAGGVVVSAIQIAFLGAVEVHGDRCLGARVPMQMGWSSVSFMLETYARFLPGWGDGGAMDSLLT